MNYINLNKGEDLILTVILYNNKRYLKAFIKAGAAVNIHRDCKGNTALMFAATQRDPEFLEILIQAGADVNAKNFRLRTALMCAVESSNIKNAELLLEARADVNVCSLNEETAFSIACRKRDIKCLDLLKNYGIDASRSGAACGRAFVNAALNGNIDAMEWFLSIGLIDVNTANYVRWTAVYTTAAYDCIESLKWLINAGADVNGTCNGKTPLIQAAKNGCHKSMKVLIEAGAGVNMICSHTGNTALIESAVANQTHCVRLLLQSGAHVNTYNYHRFNALQSHMVYSEPLRKQVAMLLFAAGDVPFTSKTFRPSFHGDDAIGNPIVDFYNQSDVVDLKDICRRVIRAHLIRIEPRFYLFHTIPKIRLPTLLVSYLLYNVSWSDTNN